MKGIIWYNEKSKIEAEEIYNNIRDYYKEFDLLQYETRYYFFTKENEIWYLMPMNDKARGHKCNVAYIPRSVSEEELDNIIIPSNIASPWQAHHYYS